MDLEIKNFRCIPCELEVFSINGKNADCEDFGMKIMRDGSCMENECGCEFHPKMPTEEVLEKYGITLAEYSKITIDLKDALCVYSCGWCS